MVLVLEIIDYLLFIIIGFSVFYIFFFAWASLKKWNFEIPKSLNNYKILVLIPAYKDDIVIEKTVKTLLQQRYDAELYDIVVISDHISDSVNNLLAELPIILFKPKFEQSSKAKSLKYAIENLSKSTSCKYDIVTILDSDNIVNDSYLQDLANAYHQGMRAIQCHRVAKNRNTSTAILDAVSEEINNSIFRKGHVNRGISSALIGSGMAFDYSWFITNVTSLCTAGEDKELEVLLLKQRIFIDYLDNTLVYDEKVANSNTFYNQRRRWLAAQFSLLMTSVKEFPYALFSGNIDYADKLLQWMFLPRVIILCIVVTMSVLLPFINILIAIKWWFLTLMLLFAFAFAIPDYLVDDKFKKAIFHVPLMGLMMIVNMFRLRNVNKKFIHTKKTGSVYHENSN